jgi:hypothetical protein
MPLVNKRAILETLERPTLERLVDICTRRREAYNLAVYGRNPLFDDPLMGNRLDLSEPLADAELVDYLMRARIFDAHDVIEALDKPELWRACAALCVEARGDAEDLRRALEHAVHTDRPPPRWPPGCSPNYDTRPPPYLDPDTSEFVKTRWDPGNRRWVWPEGKAPPEGHDRAENEAAAASEPRG